jgi:hypothetical protein
MYLLPIKSLYYVAYYHPFWKKFIPASSSTTRIPLEAVLMIYEASFLLSIFVRPTLIVLCLIAQYYGSRFFVLVVNMAF